MNTIQSHPSIQFGFLGLGKNAKKNQPVTSDAEQTAKLIKQKLSSLTQRTKTAYKVEISTDKEGNYILKEGAPQIKVTCNDPKIHHQLKELLSFKNVELWQPTYMPHAAVAKAENLIDGFHTFPVRDGKVEDLVSFSVKEEGPADKEYAVITVTPNTNNWSRIESVLSYGGVYGVIKPNRQPIKVPERLSPEVLNEKKEALGEVGFSQFLKEHYQTQFPVKALLESFELVVDRHGNVTQPLQATVHETGEKTTVNYAVNSTN